MKYLIYTVLTLLLPFGLKAQNKIKIVSSASMFTDMTKNLMTDDFEIQTIVPIGADPHKYKAKPSDARMVQQADLILVNGLTFEGWIKELIENSGSKASVVTITEGIQVISSMQYKNSSDPHAWMDASNGLIYIKNIKDALISLKPDRENEIQTNYEKYKAELEILDATIKNEILKIPENQRVLITSHDAFQYYGMRYGLQLEAIMGISTEAEAQTSDIIRVAKVIQENHVPAVFVESTINPKMLKQIATDNGVAIGGELYADSLGDEKSEGSTYIKMLMHNTKTIVDALSKTKQTDKVTAPKPTKSPPDLTSGLNKTTKIALAAGLLLGMIAVIAFKLKNNGIRK